MILIKLIAWVVYFIIQAFYAIFNAPINFHYLVSKEVEAIYRRKRHKKEIEEQLKNAGSKGYEYD